MLMDDDQTLALTRLRTFRERLADDAVIDETSGLRAVDLDLVLAACQPVSSRVQTVSALVLAGSHEGQVIEIDLDATLVEIPREDALMLFTMPATQALEASSERYVVVPYVQPGYAWALIPAGDRDLRAAVAAASDNPNDPAAHALRAELQRRYLEG